MMFLAALALAAATPAEEAEIKRYYAMLNDIRSDEVVFPIMKCGVTKIRDHQPQDAELGDIKKAGALLHSSMEACGFTAGSETIKTSLKAKYPQASSAEIEKASQHAFAIPYALLLGEAVTKLKVPLPPNPPGQPIEIPCPPEYQRDQNHPCFVNK